MANNGETLDLANGLVPRQSRGNPYDVAWLAGIIDGEGHIGLRMNHPLAPKDLHFDVVLTIGSTSFELLEKAQRVIFELTHVKPEIREANGTNRFGTKQFWQIQVYRQDCVSRICEACLPHLTEKRHRAELMVGFCQARKERRHKNRNARWGSEEFRILMEFEQYRRAPWTETQKAILLDAMGAVETECHAPGAAPDEATVQAVG